MKKLLLLLVLFACLGLSAQDDFELIEEQLLDSRKVTVFTDSTEIRFQLVKLNQNSVSFQDTAKYYHWYRAQHVFKTQGGFSGRLLDGEYMESFPNHALKETGCFKKGLKVGKWKSWFANGNLNTITNYTRGKKNGLFVVYSEKGEIVQSGKYKKGKLHGKYQFWDGSTFITDRYKRGRLKADKAPKVKKLKVKKQKKKKEEKNSENRDEKV